jgi:hypothetical protein
MLYQRPRHPEPLQGVEQPQSVHSEQRAGCSETRRLQPTCATGCDVVLPIGKIRLQERGAELVRRRTTRRHARFDASNTRAAAGSAGAYWAIICNSTDPSIGEGNGPADEGSEQGTDHRTQRPSSEHPLCTPPRALSLQSVRAVKGSMAGAAASRCDACAAPAHHYFSAARRGCGDPYANCPGVRPAPRRDEHLIRRRGHGLQLPFLLFHSPSFTSFTLPPAGLPVVIQPPLISVTHELSEVNPRTFRDPFAQWASITSPRGEGDLGSVLIGQLALCWAGLAAAAHSPGSPPFLARVLCQPVAMRKEERNRSSARRTTRKQQPRHISRDIFRMSASKCEHLREAGGFQRLYIL